MRGARPLTPFRWAPFVGLAALFLYALFPFAKGWIEATAKGASEDALRALGADWAEIDVSGQRVTIIGTPPSETAGDAAVAAIREATVPTFLGPARPVTWVALTSERETDEGRQPTPAVETPETPTEQTNTEGVDNAAQPNASPAIAQTPARSLLEPTERGLPEPAWRFALRDGVLEMDGRVANEEMRAAILQAARNDPSFGGRPIEEELIPAAVAGGEAQFAVALRGIQTLSRCNQGMARFADNQFYLICELPEAEVDALNVLAREPLPVGAIGSIEILPAEAVAQCENAMASILGEARIEFAVGSAAINASSAPLLDTVAETAIACPGVLVVEGHTDNTGGAAANQALSLARADAVRGALIERGIAADRLTAAGFGDRTPIANNDTSEGRARNRRIEIRVDRTTR